MLHRRDFSVLFGGRVTKMFRRHIAKAKVDPQIFWGRVLEGTIKARRAQDASGDHVSLALFDAVVLRHKVEARHHNLFVIGEEVMDFIESVELDYYRDYQAIIDVCTRYLSGHVDGVAIHLWHRPYSILAFLVPVGVAGQLAAYGTLASRDCAHLCRASGDGEGDEDIGYFPFNEKPESMVKFCRDTACHSSNRSWHTLFALLLYMDAFPECVRSGAPEIDKVDQGRHQGNGTVASIVASAKLTEAYRHRVSPHFRRGHFRFLKDERYKAKRYQTIYVKPTVVGGSAETVLSPEETE